MAPDESRHRRKIMRRAVLVVLCASCGGLLLLGWTGLACLWMGEAWSLVLPRATNVQIAQASLFNQAISYHLPTGQSPDDLYTQLVQHGWARDQHEELAVTHDQGGTSRFEIFWRDADFGLVPEVITVRRAAPDRRAVDIELSRCFALGAQIHCL
jgi:hypothetical protein